MTEHGPPGGIVFAPGVPAAEAGEAIRAVLGPCPHHHTIPVDLALTGEIVAALCADCSRQLPTSWLCPTLDPDTTETEA